MRFFYISCIVPFCRTFNSSLDLLLIELKYGFFCSFVAAAGVLFPVKWMFQFGQIAPVKMSAVACTAIPNVYRTYFFKAG